MYTSLHLLREKAKRRKTTARLRFPAAGGQNIPILNAILPRSYPERDSSVQGALPLGQEY